MRATCNICSVLRNSIQGACDSLNGLRSHFVLLEQFEIGREILKRRDLSPKVCLQILFKCLLDSELNLCSVTVRKNPGESSSWNPTSSCSSCWTNRVWNSNSSKRGFSKHFWFSIDIRKGPWLRRKDNILELRAVLQNSGHS